MRLRLAGAVVLGLALFLALVGCGGGGGGGGSSGGGSGGAAQAGTLQASVNLAGRSPFSLAIEIDGKPVNVAVGDDGSFTISGLPAGEHVVDVIADGGFAAGRSTFTITPGAEVVLPPIDLIGAGQIAGLVSKKTSAGLEPLPGVEVVARGDVIVILDGGSAVLAPEGGSPSQPLIYPPPPGVSYSAFTDETGSYVMKGVQPGNYFVTVVVPGLTPGYAYVTVRAGRTTPCDFILEPAIEPGIGTVKGTVVEDVGNLAVVPAPIAGAEVIIIMDTGPQPVPLPPESPPPAPPSLDAAQAGGGDSPYDGAVPPPIWWGRYRTVTDANGQYSINVPSGRGAMWVWAEGYEPGYSELTVYPNETTVKDFALRRLELPPQPPPPWPPIEPPPPPPGEPGTGPPPPPSL